ncbi:hypothetical protein HGRIS_005222 [Hohenbuehelia grisea]|uniref:Carnitine/acyl carnitine carrier n=1 Tax=Hohenbuehelia grisea TaxID=104357 RepID=A0ABR3JEJ9_9AGAR
MGDTYSESSSKAQELDPRIDFIAGTVAGAAGLVVGFPFDTVKVRFQSPQIAGRYHSTIHALTTIVREERFFGLYKGVTSPLAACALLNGMVFASYRVFMKMQIDHTNSLPTLTQIALAGAGSGIVSSLITTPTELIKIRQQSSLTPTSARTVALQIFREAGVRGLFRGITATALRDCGYGAYFAAYEATCRYFTPVSPQYEPPDHLSIFSEVESDVNKLPWYAMLIAGGVAGIAGWLFTFPMDVVKTRVQGCNKYPPGQLPYPTRPGISHSASSTSLASPSPSTHLLTPRAHETGLNPYRSTLSTIINSYRAEGISVFFRGLIPTLVRAVPTNMATFAVFELVVHAIS